MKKLLKKWRHKIVLYVFNYYFGHFVYSFTTPDAKITAMNDTDRGTYYRMVVEWYNSNAYKVEHLGELEDAYYELAAKSPNEDVMTAYRLLILREKNREIRLQTKVAEYMALRATQKTQSNIK